LRNVLYSLYKIHLKEKQKAPDFQGIKMEIRKLQRIKGGSFTLSLPKDWVERRKLQKGVQITVSEEEDGSLRLYPTTMTLETALEIELSLQDYPNLRALEHIVSTYYIQGSNKISITSHEIIPADQKRRLKLLRTDLPGVEIAEEEAKKLSFQVLIDPAAFSLESLIEKTATFSLHLQQDAVRSMVEQDSQLAEEVLERSREAQRHYRMTIRQVALASLNKSIAEKAGVRSCQECITFALVARDLSRLVYHSSLIARHVLNLKDAEIDPEILDVVADMSDVAHGMQKAAVRAFLQKDVKLAAATMETMNIIRKQEKALLTRIRHVGNVDTAVTLGMIARDLRRIAGYSVAIADDAMNRVLTPQSHNS
jgi:phosphate uptake regulator